MSKKNWQRIADVEFDAMPKEYKSDWRDFRDHVMSR